MSFSPVDQLALINNTTPVSRANPRALITDKVLAYIAEYLPLSSLKTLFEALEGPARKHQKASLSLLQELKFLPKLNMASIEQLVRFAKKQFWSADQLIQIANHAQNHSSQGQSSEWIAYTRIMGQVHGKEIPYIFLQANLAEEDEDLAISIIKELSFQLKKIKLESSLSHQVTTLIAEFLSHREDRVRHFAIESLADGSRVDHLKILTNYVDIAPEEDLNTLIHALDKFEDSKLISSMWKIFIKSHNHPLVQLKAIRNLISIQPKNMFEYLSENFLVLQGLFSQHEFELGTYLVMTGHNEALPCLEWMAGSGIPYLQEEALKGLAELGKGLDIIKRVIEENEEVLLKELAIEALEGFNTPEAEAYLYTLCEGENLDNQRIAIGVLARKDPSSSLPYIMKAIERKDRPIDQACAFSLLSKMRGEEAINTFLYCAENLEDYPLAPFAKNLCLLDEDPQKLLPAFLKVLQALHQGEEDNTLLIQEIFYKLQSIKTPETKKVFLTALKSEDPLLRIAAMNALKNDTSKLVLDGLIAMVQDPDESVRLCLANLLKEVNSQLACQALQSLAYDKKLSVAISAVDSLIYRVKRSFLQGRLKQLLEPIATKNLATFTSSYRLLINFASHSSQEIRQKIFRMWGDIGGNLAFTHLKKRLEQESDTLVLEEVMVSLEKLAEA